MFVLSRDQVRELDRKAIEEFGLPGLVLMENAGRGVAELLLSWNPNRDRVLILCGPGNNGGDGFVIARHLQNHGVEADVLLFGTMDRLTPDARVNALVWQKTGPLWTVPTDRPLDVEARRIVDGAPGWIVDALFGTGLTRPLGAPFDALVSRVNRHGRAVVAVDLPSGLDCDTGRPMGPTVRATHTATFVAPKLGFQNPEAAEWLGTVHVVDIGAPMALVDRYKSAP